MLILLLPKIFEIYSAVCNPQSGCGGWTLKSRYVRLTCENFFLIPRFSRQVFAAFSVSIFCRFVVLFFAYSNFFSEITFVNITFSLILLLTDIIRFGHETLNGPLINKSKR